MIGPSFTGLIVGPSFHWAYCRAFFSLGYSLGSVSRPCGKTKKRQYHSIFYRTKKYHPLALAIILACQKQWIKYWLMKSSGNHML
jgi:hypothetical protein